MGNLIVKSNALIEASYSLDAVEQRVILLAILEARALNIEIGLGTRIKVYASNYANTYGISKDMAYKAMKKAVLGLHQAEFRWSEMTPKGVKHTHSRFTDTITYCEGEGCIELIFGSQVIPQIIDLKKLFTSYEIEQTRNLNRYGLRLYELLIRWRAKGKAKMSLNDLRNTLGVLDDEYQAMGDFKKRVLDIAVSEINANTDITTSYEQHKQGRKIIGFTFTIKQKSTAQQTKQTANINLDNLTDQERDIIAQKNAYADSIGATAEHRQNLINQALKQHQDAIQAEQEAKQRKKAERQAQKEHEKQQLELARKQYEQILASDTLINAYIANNINPQKMRASLQKMRYEQGDFRSVVEMEQRKFEHVHEWQRLNLKFLDGVEE